MYSAMKSLNYTALYGDVLFYAFCTFLRFRGLIKPGLIACVPEDALAELQIFSDSHGLDDFKKPCHSAKTNSGVASRRRLHQNGASVKLEIL